MNVPQLRFDGFDGEWEEENLNNIFLIKSSSDLKNELLNNERTEIHYYPVYANSISNYGLLGYYKDFDYEGPALTVTARGVNIGYPIERTEPFNAVGRLLVLELLDKEYNYKFFCEVIRGIEIFNETTGVPQLTAPSFGAYKVAFPKPQEQKKIGHFYKLIDQRIEKQKEKIEKLEQFKKGMMQKVFSRELRFKDEDGGEFPEWDSLHFVDVVEKLIGGGTPSRQVEEYYSGSIPWVTVKDLKTNKYVSEAMEYITELGLKNSSAKIVNSGDLIIPTRMAVGRVLIATEKVAINQDLKGCKLKPQYDNEFIYYLYFSKSASIERLGSGSTVSGINIEELMKIKIQVPILEEQKKVADYLGKIDKKIEKEKEKLMVLEEQKRGFTQGMFV